MSATRWWVGGPDPAAEGGKSGVTGGKLNPSLLHHLPARRMANSEFAFPLLSAE